jgi:tRNA nucleotidyltransferase/poly(A) polymerase
MNIDLRKPQLLKDLASLSARLPPMFEVGGAVRDRLLGRETCDIDVAAHGPEKAARLMERTLGTKTVAFHRENRTAACYRIISANDPGIHLDLVHIQGESIERDLARRDFTINAMARPLGAEKDTEIIDPFGGREDLRQVEA